MCVDNELEVDRLRRRLNGGSLMPMSSPLNSVYVIPRESPQLKLTQHSAFGFGSKGRSQLIHDFINVLLHMHLICCFLGILWESLFCSTAINTHLEYARPRMAASLDHAMWFHRQFRVNEWMLYDMEAPAMAYTY